jgi:hypothetical protein
MTDWLDEVQKMDSQTLASLMKLGSKVQQLLVLKDKVKQAFSFSNELVAQPESPQPREVPSAESAASPVADDVPLNPPKPARKK